MNVFEKNIDGKYKVTVIKNGDQWRLKVVSGNNSFIYTDYKSQQAAEDAADEMCTKITQGEFTL